MNLNFDQSYPSPNFTNLRHWWHKVNCWKWTELALVPCMSRIHSLIHTTPNRLLTASLRLGLGLDSLTPQSTSPLPFLFSQQPCLLLSLHAVDFITHFAICIKWKWCTFLFSYDNLPLLIFFDFHHTHTYTGTVWRQCLRSSSSLRAALHVFWMTLSAAMQTFSNEHLVQIDWTQAQVTGPVCVCASGCASVPVRVCVVCVLVHFCILQKLLFWHSIACQLLVISCNFLFATAAQRVAPWISLEYPLLNQSWHYALH